MRKVIFLDFDGVLNSVGTKDRIAHPIINGRKTIGLDSFRVKLVSDIANFTLSEVVVTSSWRNLLSFEDIAEILRNRGFSAKIAGITDLSLCSDTSLFLVPHRSEEIESWMKKNYMPDRFLILDESPTKFVNNQIVTDRSTGFFDGLSKRAIRILNSD